MKCPRLPTDLCHEGGSALVRGLVQMRQHVEQMIEQAPTEVCIELDQVVGDRVGAAYHGIQEVQHQHLPRQTGADRTSGYHGHWSTGRQWHCKTVRGAPRKYL